MKGLDQRLRHQSYLCGAAFSVADAALAPFVRQYANTDRAWFDAQADLAALQTWLDGILGSDRFTAVMAKAPLWKETGIEVLFPPD